jgi:hypothetical protein
MRSTLEPFKPESNILVIFFIEKYEFIQPPHYYLVKKKWMERETEMGLWWKKSVAQLSNK